MPPAKKAAPRKATAKPVDKPEDEAEISDHEARPWDPGAGHG
jgi:hypothetical protein